MSNKFLGKARDIYNKALSKSKSNLNISFNQVKDSIYKKLNAETPPIPNSVEEIPNNFESFTTVEGKNHLLFKDKFLIILKSERMLNLLYAYIEEILIDSTFKVCQQ